MSKISADQADSFCARPPARCRLVLVYGPDEGLVRERVTALMRSVLPDLNDPFRLSDLTMAALKGDPARLIDEASAMAFGGGRRVVRLRDADDSLNKTVQSLLAQGQDPGNDTLVILQAGDLPAKSTLRKLAETAQGAAAVPCYLDDAQTIAAVTRQFLEQAGYRCVPEAFDLLTASLGGDRMVTRSELDKLLTWLGGPRQPAGSLQEVSVDDVMACIGDVSAMTMDDLVFGLAEGNDTVAQSLLDRLAAEGESMVAILRALSRHFLRLHLAGGALAQGRSDDQALALLRPPVFFRNKSRFLAQLRRWPPARVAQALDLLIEAEKDCKSTGMPDHEIVSRTFLQIARAARARS